MKEVREAVDELRRQIAPLCNFKAPTPTLNELYDVMKRIKVLGEIGVEMCRSAKATQLAGEFTFSDEVAK